MALVLGVFSRSKLRVLGRPGDGEVVLTGGALVMGSDGWCQHGVRRSRAEAWTRSGRLRLDSATWVAIFPKFPKLVQICKFKTDAFH
jgi:hypothetical protein